MVAKRNIDVSPDKLRRAEEALEAANGNKAEAARMLGVSRSTLRHWLDSARHHRENGKTVYQARADGTFIPSEGPRTPKAKQKFKKWFDFAAVWNAPKKYPTNHDMERALGIKAASIHKRADKYRKFRQKNHEGSLPRLIWRRTKTGIEIPGSEMTQRQLDEFRIEVSKLQSPNGIVVTSAQFGAVANDDVLTSLKLYCGYMGYELVIMPIKYGPIHEDQDGRLTTTFPDEMKGHMIFEDRSFASGHLTLNVARMRPTLERFLTASVCEMGGSASQIFAAPMMELEHTARIGYDYPKASMTTGSVSEPNYSTDRLGQQDRTGEVAMSNHDYGAIVVEFAGEKTFHFRQLLSNRKGEFYDIDPRRGGALFVSPKGGVEHRPDAVAGMVCGDWHTGKTCPVVREVTMSAETSMAQKLHPDAIVLHDFTDGDSVSHYEKYQASRRGWKGPLQYDSLQHELDENIKELEWIDELTPWATKYIVASNHPEFITEYVEMMRWAKDDANLAIGARLYAMMVEDLERRNPIKVEAIATDPVVEFFRKNAPERCVPLQRTDTLLLPIDLPDRTHQILCSLHGDVGVRGGPTRSTREFCKLNQRIVLGHNHSATIMKSVWRAGVSTPLTQFYVKNPSTNWTNTHCVIFENGQRMLVNIINGKWHG